MFLSHLDLRAEAAGRYQAWVPPISLSIPSGSVVSHSFDERAQRLAGDPGVYRGANVVADLEDDAWSEVTRRALRDSDLCYVTEFFLKTDPTYLQILATLGEQLRTIEATGSILFWSVKEGRMIEKPISVIAVAFQRHEPQCEQ